MSDNEIVGEFLVESYENLDSDFPRAAVMPAVVDLFLNNDDGSDGGHWTGSDYAAFAGASAPSALRPLMCASTSWNVGLTCPGMARRANSTATVGAAPFMKLISTMRRT